MFYEVKSTVSLVKLHLFSIHSNKEQKMILSSRKRVISLFPMYLPLLAKKTHQILIWIFGIFMGKKKVKNHYIVHVQPNANTWMWRGYETSWIKKKNLKAELVCISPRVGAQFPRSRWLSDVSRGALTIWWHIHLASPFHQRISLPCFLHSLPPWTISASTTSISRIQGSESLWVLSYPIISMRS